MFLLLLVHVDDDDGGTEGENRPRSLNIEWSYYSSAVERPRCSYSPDRPTDCPPSSTHSTTTRPSLLLLLPFTQGVREGGERREMRQICQMEL